MKRPPENATAAGMTPAALEMTRPARQGSDCRGPA